jgi:hypothetical protein
MYKLTRTPISAVHEARVDVKLRRWLLIAAICTTFFGALHHLDHGIRQSRWLAADLGD